MTSKPSPLRAAAGLLAIVLLHALATGSPVSAAAVDERELRTLRSEAQRDRQQQRKLRNQEYADAARTFRVDAGNLEADYEARARDIDTAFKLEEVALQADQERRVVTLEAELQKRVSTNVLAARGQDVAAGMQALERETRAIQDNLFDVRKEGAAMIQAARLRAEMEKDALFREMDQRALRRAEELGLTTAPPPIRATAIGGELTRQELQWNARELADVEKIAERNAKLLAKFVDGERRRAMEREILDEDFQLTWQERTELHALQSQQPFFNTFLMQGGDAAADQQTFIDRMADNTEQQRIIRIRFEQIRKENAIKRHQARRSS